MSNRIAPPKNTPIADEISDIVWAAKIVQKALSNALHVEPEKARHDAIHSAWNEFRLEFGPAFLKLQYMPAGAGALLLGRKLYAGVLAVMHLCYVNSDRSEGRAALDEAFGELTNATDAITAFEVDPAAITGTSGKCETTPNPALTQGVEVGNDLSNRPYFRIWQDAHQFVVRCVEAMASRKGDRRWYWLVHQCEEARVAERWTSEARKHGELATWNEHIHELQLASEKLLELVRSGQRIVLPDYERGHLPHWVDELPGKEVADYRTACLPLRRLFHADIDEHLDDLQRKRDAENAIRDVSAQAGELTRGRPPIGKCDAAAVRSIAGQFSQAGKRYPNVSLLRDARRDGSPIFVFQVHQEQLTEAPAMFRTLANQAAEMLGLANAAELYEWVFERLDKAKPGELTEIAGAFEAVGMQLNAQAGERAHRGADKSGRKPVGPKEAERRRKILAEWDQAKAAGTQRKEFCADKRICVDDLKRFADWALKQPSEPRITTGQIQRIIRTKC